MNVTVLSNVNGSLKIVSEEPMPYFGELDLSYNMIRKGDVSDLFYISQSKSNRVFIMNSLVGGDGLISLNIDKIIYSDGLVREPRASEQVYVDESVGEKGNDFTKRIVFFTILALVLIIGFFLIRSRFKKERTF